MLQAAPRAGQGVAKVQQQADAKACSICEMNQEMPQNAMAESSDVPTVASLLHVKHL